MLKIKIVIFSFMILLIFNNLAHTKKRSKVVMNVEQFQISKESNEKLWENITRCQKQGDCNNLQSGKKKPEQNNLQSGKKNPKQNNQ